jgi:hypothetical protein
MLAANRRRVAKANVFTLAARGSNFQRLNYFSLALWL